MFNALRPKQLSATEIFYSPDNHHSVIYICTDLAFIYGRRLENICAEQATFVRQDDP